MGMTDKVKGTGVWGGFELVREVDDNTRTLNDKAKVDDKMLVEEKKDETSPSSSTTK